MNVKRINSIKAGIIKLEELTKESFELLINTFVNFNEKVLGVSDKNINMMAVFGAINKTTVTFDKPGVYDIVCHEYCGVGHQNMRAQVIVNYPDAK